MPRRQPRLPKGKTRVPIWSCLPEPVQERIRSDAERFGVFPSWVAAVILCDHYRYDVVTFRRQYRKRRQRRR